MSETPIKNQVLKWLRLQPRCGYAIKIHGGPMQERGVPDIFFSWNGRFCAVELKVPGKKPDDLQQRHIDTINRVGGHAFCAHSLEEVKRELYDPSS